MELRHPRYFVAVAGDLSITRAAIRLNIAQPALSHQVRSLEQEVGTALLRRLPRGVALTGPGVLFAEDARAILAAVNAAKVRAGRVDVAFPRPSPGEVDQLWSRHLFDEPMVLVRAELPNTPLASISTRLTPGQL